MVPRLFAPAASASSKILGFSRTVSADDRAPSGAELCRSRSVKGFSKTRARAESLDIAEIAAAWTGSASSCAAWISSRAAADQVDTAFRMS